MCYNNKGEIPTIRKHFFTAERIITMEMKVTSRKTSINKRVPAIASLLEKNVAKYVIEEGGIYDLGCGKYPEYFAEWCERRNIPYIGEDPYNISGVYTGRFAYAMNAHPCAISSNVLNVLPPIQREEYVNELLSVGTYGIPSWVFITVYEGDKSGIGKYGNDSFQANMKTEDMKDWLQTIFGQYVWERKGKLIFCKTGAEI